MKIDMVKINNALTPHGPQAEEWLKKIKNGQQVQADVVRPRNVQFHRKFFALLHLGYDNWEPPEIPPESLRAAKLPPGIMPQKDFDEWRKDIIILCGHYKVVYRGKGEEFRLVAKSISFANMEQEEFDRLYNKAINVLIQNAFTQDLTPGEIDNMVNQYLDFS